MTSTEMVGHVIDALNSSGVPYMIVGSLSTNLYGIPRSTKDADFVIQLHQMPLQAITEKLPAQIRPDPQIRFETVTGTTCYRLRHADTEFMIELFELSADDHDLLRFERRLPSTYAGKPVFIPTPEDVVITKLRWSQNGKRRKDVEDIANVLAVQQGKLDLEYIRNWCQQHGSREILETLLAEAH